MLREYVPVLLQIVVAVGFAVAALVLSVILGKTGRHTRIKDTPYECGMLPQGEAIPRFSVRFISLRCSSSLRFGDRFHVSLGGRLQEVIVQSKTIFWSMLSFVTI